jgi:hypothetical protein
VTKAICSGYKETTDPPVCLSQAVETNECLSNNGGCWHKGNITACKDTFRGRVCECPLVEGVQFEGDGYTDCQAKGLGRCNFDNNGCWKETQGGVIFTACQVLLHFPLLGSHLNLHCEVWAQDSNYSVLMEIFKSVHCSWHKRAMFSIGSSSRWVSLAVYLLDKSCPSRCRLLRLICLAQMSTLFGD